MFNKLLILLSLFLTFALLPGKAPAQSDGILQVNDPIHQFLLRQYTRGNLPASHLLHQPVAGHTAARYLDSLAQNPSSLSTVDRQLLARFRGESVDRNTSFLNSLIPFAYRNDIDLWSVRTDNYAIQLNPVLYIWAGSASRRRPGEVDDRITTWQNTRGLQVSGRIGDGFFFESRLEENQKNPPRFEIEGRTAPRLGYARSPLAQAGSSAQYDFWRAMGMVGYQNEFFEIRFGRDRNRWTPGVNSLLLSDYAPVYDQLQIRTTFWRLQYTNLFAAMEDLSVTEITARDQILPRKYGAFHSLALNVTDNLQFQIFESVVFAPDTVEFRRMGYDLAYLNPIIFYRAVEIDRGSPDNMAIGGGFSWVTIPGLRLYGQGLLTEFRASEIYSSRGWWANKWGIIGGFHTSGVLLHDLEIQFEYARVRPFTYSHRGGGTNYVHYFDVLGHPSGQNMEDYALFLRHQITARVSLQANLAFTRRGRNTEDQNFGGDPRDPYTTRETEFGNHLLQGIRRNDVLLEVHVGYELLPMLYLEAAMRYDRMKDEVSGFDRYLMPFALIRWGLPFQSQRY